jgi:hypothetical protein
VEACGWLERGVWSCMQHIPDEVVFVAGQLDKDAIRELSRWTFIDVYTCQNGNRPVGQ